MGQRTPLLLVVGLVGVGVGCSGCTQIPHQTDPKNQSNPPRHQVGTLPTRPTQLRRQSQTERSESVTIFALLTPIIINQVPYKEGDVLKARVNGNSVFVRAKHISRYSYTLALNNAELSVKY